MRVGALIIHGLGGSEHDLGRMRRSLELAGIATHAPTLPGHGGTPGDLREVRAEAWLENVTAAYDELVQRYDTFHVIGMCMGALLALLLAERRQHRKGRLVALAAPVFLDGWSVPSYRWLRHMIYRMPRLAGIMRVQEKAPFGVKNTLIRSAIKARFERGDPFHYRWVPLTCIRQVDRLRHWVLDSARGIPCPTLVANAREDELTSLRSAEFLLDAIPDAKGLILENSYHMICIDNDRKQVTRSVLDFLGAFTAREVRPVTVSHAPHGQAVPLHAFG
ncbi:alpha/beta fold hydrolase [Paraburkholderia sabiae]|uniref:Alpha/beta fold hydrolase n=1 Tax=Paraburkholderia sabiae TaxID=273251 RepID=A0ABU9QMF2_9BURK|nr:alpha/beta fold hydrolase [Paraburkholderia sabiae]WJZ79196.1 alpha/beta fold hydrolase [Paraburkholderia sabiae]